MQAAVDQNSEKAWVLLELMKTVDEMERVKKSDNDK
jgi:hypothetical protein